MERRSSMTVFEITALDSPDGSSLLPNSYQTLTKLSPESLSPSFLGRSFLGDFKLFQMIAGLHLKCSSSAGTWVHIFNCIRLSRKNSLLKNRLLSSIFSSVAQSSSFFNFLCFSCRSSTFLILLLPFPLSSTFLNLHRPLPFFQLTKNFCFTSLWVVGDVTSPI